VDDDISDHLDPELDAAIEATSDGDDTVPGPLSLAGLVVGVHLLVATALLPFAWLALQSGDHAQAAGLAAMAGLAVGVGVVFGRYTAARY
jgi:hypothetical protein